MKKSSGPGKERGDGGRLNYYDVIGRHGWTAKYVKEVDLNENTLRFYQEIYNDEGKLVEIHQKFPEDTGHTKVTSSEND